MYADRAGRAGSRYPRRYVERGNDTNQVKCGEKPIKMWYKSEIKPEKSTQK